MSLSGHRPAIRNRTRAVLALLGVLALCCVDPPAFASMLVPPSQDAFYTYSGSTPLADLAPGTVLAKRAITVTTTVPDTGLTLRYAADQLLYRTVGEQQQPTATVTTVIKPKVHAGHNIVSVQTAYDALGSQCDPSYTLRGGNPGNATATDEAAIMNAYLLLGDYVVVPDYEGTDLEWAAGQESGWDTLDGVRAAEQDLGLPASAKVALTGYSGGSIATEWASELAPDYAPELHIVGAAEGGIPVDFAHNLNYINGSPDWSGVIPAVLVSLSRAFGIDLDEYLSPYGKQVTDQVQDGCINDFVGNYPGLTIQQLLKPGYQDFLSVPVFAQVVDHLIMGSTPGRPRVPLLMVVGNSDGTGDGVMVSKDVEALAHEYCRQGVPVDFLEERGADHTTAAIPFEAVLGPAQIQAWFAGLPPVNDCMLVGRGNSLAPLPQG
jgi:hypothetical protein